MNKFAIILTVLVLFSLAFGKPHKCIQDKLNIKFGFTDETEDEKEGGRVLAGREKMRVTFDFSTLNQFTGDQVPLAEEVKRQTLLAGHFFSNNLMVNRQVGNLRFPSSESQCVDAIVSQQDKTVGIPNSDLHIYVNVFNDPNSNTLAYASPCILNRGDNRPVFGGFSINLAFFQKSDVGKVEIFEDNFETIVHELTHILGFSQSMYSYFINPATGRAYGGNTPILEQTIRGIKTLWLTTPKVKQLARQYYDCSSAPGMQLENEGGSGSAHSHWERVVLENDYMTASAIGHDAVISRFTLALLEDSGWYTPTYQYVDEISWGKGQGCNFLYECDSNKYREFNTASRQCNFYHSSIAQYSNRDPFGDKCYISKEISNLYCSNADNAGSNDQYTGMTYAEKSRCFDSNIIDSRVNSNSFPNQRCMEYKCNENATKIEISVLGEKYIMSKEQNKIQVSPKGKNRYIEGYIEGPADWNGFCNHYPTPCSNYCSSYGYCLAKTCHCLEDRAGEDCSIVCANGNYVYNGRCIDSKRCPAGTSVHEPTKECKRDSSAPVTCLVGQYLSEQNTCQQCSDKCVQCTSATNCQACQLGYKLANKGGVVSCEKEVLVPTPTTCGSRQFLNSKNQCENCDNSCATCTNASTCSTCYRGTFLNSENSKCEPCYDGCTSCTKYDFCQSCKSGYLFVNYQQHRVCMTSCPDGLSVQSNGECGLSGLLFKFSAALLMFVIFVTLV